MALHFKNTGFSQTFFSFDHFITAERKRKESAKIFGMGGAAPETGFARNARAPMPSGIKTNPRSCPKNSFGGFQKSKIICRLSRL